MTSDSQHNLIADTIAFIKEAHKGQMYAAGQEYWTHPYAVAQAIPNPTTREYLAALLHDVVEDTQYTEADLRKMYDDSVVDIVMLLTMQKGLSYKDYLQKLIDSGNTSAMKVKLADVTVNAAGDKSKMSQERRERLIRKQTLANQMLKQALGLPE